MVEKMKSQLVAAADRAAMSVAYGQEAADHYGIQYGFIRSVRDWITGFTEGIKGERCWITPAFVTWVLTEMAVSPVTAFSSEFFH